MIATPAAMTNVIPNSTGADGPMPRAAEAAATSSSPAMAARRAPSRAISSEPGIAASPNSNTGMPDNAPIPRSLSARSRWISGKTGGTASTVSRRSAPASHSTTSPNSAAPVDLVIARDYSAPPLLRQRGRLTLFAGESGDIFGPVETAGHL